jgi:hypothetical protein
LARLFAGDGERDHEKTARSHCADERD